ncbi:hypothetical protein [Aeromicrobium sp. 179-A 4D2 NHS]|uniref:hypothetical protein n=1 Tax=Aeromicrobium sp. 179-A 4D2 NHS TaxID=3142375 RepID=UPI00399EF6FF
MQQVEAADPRPSVDFRYELVVMAHRLFDHVNTVPIVTVHDPTRVTFTWLPETGGTVRLTFIDGADFYEAEHTTDGQNVTWVIGSDWGDTDVFETITRLLRTE